MGVQTDDESLEDRLLLGGFLGGILILLHLSFGCLDTLGKGFPFGRVLLDTAVTHQLVQGAHLIVQFFVALLRQLLHGRGQTLDMAALLRKGIGDGLQMLLGSPDLLLGGIRVLLLQTRELLCGFLLLGLEHLDAVYCLLLVDFNDCLECFVMCGHNKKRYIYYVQIYRKFYDSENTIAC